MMNRVLAVGITVCCVFFRRRNAFEDRVDGEERRLGLGYYRTGGREFFLGMKGLDGLRRGEGGLVK